MSTDPYDVAIVGAGPVGAVAAKLCGIHRLSAVAFDREVDVYDLPRAAGLHDDAQRILHNAGLLDAILPTTREMRGAEFVDASGKRIIGLDIPPGLVTPNGYPLVLNIDQPSLERAVRSRLAEHDNISLQLAHEVLEIEDRGDHVALTVRDLVEYEVKTIHARWVIGCDGASSFVRRVCGIRWDSLGYDRDWLVVDVELTGEVELPPLCQQICDPDRPTTVVPMPGRQRRWEFQLALGETREEMERPERVWGLLSPWLTPGDGEIRRAVVYRFHSTIADTFRRGRFFLAGDAAHQTPPFLGQGLCTGLRDVDNLVWKLAAVVRGRAGDGLLDTYSFERRPMAVAMVEHSTNTGKLIDAYSEMARGGPEPSTELQQYAYGGNRRLPELSCGLLAETGGSWVGQLIPHTRVATSTGERPLDDVIGPRWAIVSKSALPLELTEATELFCDEFGGVCIVVTKPGQNIGCVLDEHEAVIVRPDRIVYGPATLEVLATLTQRLRAPVTAAA